MHANTAAPPRHSRTNSHTNGKALTLADLARAKSLPLEFLRDELGLHDLPGRGVGVPYYDVAGEEVGQKVRIGIGKPFADPYDHRSWPKGQPVAAYGQNRLNRAAKVGSLIVTEGESDCWALWHHGQPALGLPGAHAAKALLREHVEAVNEIYIVREPDNGGAAFIEGVTKRLAELGFKGDVYGLRMPDGLKDPSDLHINDPGAFKERLKRAILSMERIKLATTAEGKAPKLAEFKWEPINSAAFATADYRAEWLCKGILVAHQPCVIGGPQKVLKTSAALDLAISLASGTPFLNRFPCPRPRRVAVLSGESGPLVLQETAKRICAAKGLTLADLADNLRWQFTLPQLASMEQLAALGAGIAADGIEAVVIDPLYLALLAGGDGAVRAENLFETGPLLLRVAQTCLNAGATPLLLHHARKGAGKERGADKERQPLDLTDLAFSGVAEFARQWLLLSRREDFVPGSGQHRLWLVVGGSVGHSGQYAVDVDEGQLSEDFTGRTWEVQVKTASEARQGTVSAKADKKEQGRLQQIKDNGTKVLNALDKLAGDDGAAGYREVRILAGLNPDNMDRAVFSLIGEGIVEEATAKSKSGKGHKVAKDVKGLRRARRTADGTDGTDGTDVVLFHRSAS